MKCVQFDVDEYTYDTQTRNYTSKYVILFLLYGLDKNYDYVSKFYIPIFSKTRL
jgi:hypothetical protein